jgi:hypothetical protein
VAKIIEFYIPKDIRKKPTWTPRQQSGKLIEFCSEPKKSA